MNYIGILEVGNVKLATLRTDEQFKVPIHTMFFTELGVRQPFVARREVK